MHACKKRCRIIERYPLQSVLPILAAPDECKLRRLSCANVVMLQSASELGHWHLAKAFLQPLLQLAQTRLFRVRGRRTQGPNPAHARPASALRLPRPIHSIREVKPTIRPKGDIRRQSAGEEIFHLTQTKTRALCRHRKSKERTVGATTAPITKKERATPNIRQPRETGITCQTAGTVSEMCDGRHHPGGLAVMVLTPKPVFIPRMTKLRRQRRSVVIHPERAAMPAIVTAFH